MRCYIRYQDTKAAYEAALTQKASLQAQISDHRKHKTALAREKKTYGFPLLLIGLYGFMRLGRMEACKLACGAGVMVWVVGRWAGGIG